MATKSIKTDSKPTVVGSNGTKVYTFTETTYQTDSNGKPISGSGVTNLYYGASPTSYLLAGTSKDGGNSWTYVKDPNNAGGYILGADARKSLETGALKTNTQSGIKDAAKKAGLSEQDTKAITAKNNKATPSSPEAGNVGAGSSTGTGPTKEQLDDELKNAKERKTGYGSLQYPLTLNTQTQDYMLFEILEYVARGTGPQAVDAQGGGGSAGVVSSAARESGQRNKKGTITLYIPGNISDNNAVSWGEDKMEVQDAMLASLFMGGVEGGGQGVKNELSNVGNTVANNTQEMQKLAGNALAKSATNVNTLQRNSGAIINSNLELLFQSPTLRTFNFTFKMSPREKTEADAVMQIIRAFKQSSAPKKSKGELYLKSPDTYRITYKFRGGDHPYLNRFKECALISMTVNYTPDGNYSRFYDGPMTSYEMGLTFQELEPVFDSDYGDTSSNIGY